MIVEIMGNPLLRIAAAIVFCLCFSAAASLLVQHFQKHFAEAKKNSLRKNRLREDLTLLSGIRAKGIVGSITAKHASKSRNQAIHLSKVRLLEQKPFTGLQLHPFLQSFSFGASLLALIEKAGVPSSSTTEHLNGMGMRGGNSEKLRPLSSPDSCEAYLQWWLIAALTLLLLGSLLISIVMGFMLLVIFFFATYLYLQQQVEKSSQELRTALPDMLDELAKSLRAGHSLPQSISYVLHTQDARSPIREMLLNLDADARLGRSLTGSLIDLSNSTGVAEIKTIAATIDITTKVGGSTPAIFEQTATSIRADLMLNKKLLVQTAQGRSSVRLVGSVPFLLIGLMSLIMPGYLAQWMSTPGGQFMFALAICLVVCGFLWVRKVVNIDV